MPLSKYGKGFAAHLKKPQSVISGHAQEMASNALLGNPPQTFHLYLSLPFELRSKITNESFTQRILQHSPYMEDSSPYVEHPHAELRCVSKEMKTAVDAKYEVIYAQPGHMAAVPSTDDNNAAPVGGFCYHFNYDIDVVVWSGSLQFTPTPRMDGKRVSRMIRPIGDPYSDCEWPLGCQYLWGMGNRRKWHPMTAPVQVLTDESMTRLPVLTHVFTPIMIPEWDPATDDQRKTLKGLNDFMDNVWSGIATIYGQDDVESRDRDRLWTNIYADLSISLGFHGNRCHNMYITFRSHQDTHKVFVALEFISIREAERRGWTDLGYFPSPYFKTHFVTRVEIVRNSTTLTDDNDINWIQIKEYTKGEHGEMSRLRVLWLHVKQAVESIYFRC